MKPFKLFGVLLLGTLFGIVFHTAWHKLRKERHGKHRHEHNHNSVQLLTVEQLEKNEKGLRGAFVAWTKNHRKSYSSPEEHERRFANFVSSWKKVISHNSQPSSYKLDLTSLADMSDKDFENYLGPQSPMHECWSATQREKMIEDLKEYQRTKALAFMRPLPTSVDWRAEGIVSPVKNQGHCGSCWAFSAVGALEAHYKKKYSKNMLLSEQQLLDCSYGYGNFGCDGGFPARAFEYIRQSGGLESENSYPYQVSSNGSAACRYSNSKAAMQVTHVVNVTESDEEGLVRALANAGPVTVAFLVPSDFRLYAGGVYSTNQCSQPVRPKDLTHAVLAVGYGVSFEGIQYYIIKNSWGEGWGVKGYFLFERGKNLCGIADCASYPIVA